MGPAGSDGGVSYVLDAAVEHDAALAPDAAAVDAGSPPTSTHPEPTHQCDRNSDCQTGFVCDVHEGGQRVCVCHAEAERCDGADNDCDGAADEGLSDCCKPGTTRACGRTEGVCESGTQTCGATGWGACEGAVGPSAELCDGLDNDCDPATPDGAADANLGDACDGADGDQCTDGVYSCDAGQLSCSDDSTNRQEVCDGVDNDCDGQVDEGCPKVPFSITDFDLRADGSAVVVGSQNDAVWLACLDASGNVQRAPSAVATAPSGLKLSGMDVARARTSGHVALTYSYWNWPSQPYDWRNYIMFFDEQCQLTGAASALDADLPNTNINRPGSVFSTLDGRSYVLYEHQSQSQYRVLGFDSSGARTLAVTIPTPTQCSGGALSRVLALDPSSGDFTVFCEKNGRSYRRYLANGTALDASFVAIPDSTPAGFAFHYFTGARNASGQFLYVGKNRQSPERWIVRSYDAQAQLVGSLDLNAAGGASDPRARVTSRGDFLVQLPGPDHQLALISPLGQVLESWPTAPSGFELDGSDRVWVASGSALSVSTSITLY